MSTPILNNNNANNSNPNIYASRLSRARTANQARRSTLSPQSAATTPNAAAVASPPTPDAASLGRMEAAAFRNDPQVLAAAVNATTASVTAGATNNEHTKSESFASHIFIKPSGASGRELCWAWCPINAMLAVVDTSQLLNLHDSTGKLKYKVQLPTEYLGEPSTTIYVGWEKNGRVLAAVQTRGGAYLWFPDKKTSVQQWEGMSFQSTLFSSPMFSKQTLFSSCFASWSNSGKLVLGLVDGNFAVWDSGPSNETFMSRKHFAGKHREAITCGAWSPDGSVLALGSMNQIKVSSPLTGAAWESTAAKLYTNEGGINFQELKFSPSGRLLATFAGSSVFRHFALYWMGTPTEKGASLRSVVEVVPSTSLGSLQEFLWVGRADVLILVSGNGYVRVMLYDQSTDSVDEEQFRPCDTGVVSACILPASSHLAIVTLEKVTIVDLVSRKTEHVISLPEMPAGIRLMNMEPAAHEGRDFLLLSRSDGAILKQELPVLQPLDLDLVSIASSGSKSRLSSGKHGGRVNPAALARQPEMSFAITAEEGATNSKMLELCYAWSADSRMLAVYNSAGELRVYAHDGDGARKCVLSNDTANVPCSFLEWDSTGTRLGVCLRGHGIGIWKEGNDSMTMFHGMSFKNLFVGSTDRKVDPVFATWSNTGQLAIGMKSGSFSVWDTISGEVSVSGKAGKHRQEVTAGTWAQSMFAPALALASVSTIKVSDAFQGVEWESTALKLKLPKAMPGESVAGLSHHMDSMSTGGGTSGVSPTPRRQKSVRKSITNIIKRRRARADMEGMAFSKLAFNTSGRWLATLSHPTTAPEEKQVVVYELQDSRSALVPVREMASDDVAPFDLVWLIDNSLVVFSGSATSGRIDVIRPDNMTAYSTEPSYPAAGAQAPGALTAGAASPSGLLALSWRTPTGGGAISILSASEMQILAEMPTVSPPLKVGLQPDFTDDGHHLTISYESGGVQVWRV